MPLTPRGGPNSVATFANRQSVRPVVWQTSGGKRLVITRSGRYEAVSLSHPTTQRVVIAVLVDNLDLGQQSAIIVQGII
jgi:hypothetical protein